MKITIQALDYSAALDAIHPLTIERKLNQPTACHFWLSLSAQGNLAAPVRNQPVTITGDDGTLYFTGYIASSPVPEYAGLAMEGPRYRFAIRALSDEMLMDQLPSTPMRAASGMTAAQLISSLVAHTRSAPLSLQASTLQEPITSFSPAPGAAWSEIAGQVANQARASYRTLGGVLSLSEIPAALHQLNESDGSLNLASLSFDSTVARQPANDITVCGQHEPVAYVTEYFVGDGSTSQFILAEPPYFPSAATARIIGELFNQPELDQSSWAISGGADYLSLGAGGLTMNGGSGLDGHTMLTGLDSVELGGTLLVEASGVMLSPGSNGVLAGLYFGADTVSGCVSGFQAKAEAGAGAVSVQPIVLGEAVGMAYPLNPTNQYTLRFRLHCPESQRSLAVYRSFGDAGAVAYGGQANLAPAKLLFEIQECVNAVAGMPVTLYDGAINTLPPTASIVAASLVNVVGSMRAFRVTSLGTAWVTSTPAGGGPYTRPLGSPAEGGQCNLQSSGTLVFSTGYAPAPGELVAVSYRTFGRALGRAVDAASQQALAAAGLPAVAQWIGSVASPPARSSADCRNAAAALVAAASDKIALSSGKYRCPQSSLSSDVWPGDALLLNATSLNLCTQVVIRTVVLTYASTYPDLVAYEISFANDWAEDLSIDTRASVAADAWLPPPTAPTYLPNLTNLTVTAIDTATVTIDTGASPPAGGGFEIRRRDFAFMPGEDSDLVMRGSQPTMTFSRERAGDRFFIRMYDGSTPPNYSEFSTALFINLPVSSGQ